MADETTIEETVENLDTETPEEKPIEDKKEAKVEPETEHAIETRPVKEDKVEYGEDIDPDDVKTIGTIVEKQTEGLKRTMQETQDRLDVASFVKDNPTFAKYEGTILKYVTHQAYKQVPVRNIANMIAADDLMKIGAVKEREAQARADATKGGGNTVRKPGGTVIDWSKASKEEVEMQKRRVLGQIS